MNGISHINIVIQQGDSIRDTQQMKSHNQTPEQVAESAIPDQDALKRTTVQKTNDSEKSSWNREGKRREQERKKAARRRKSSRGRKKNSKHIVDTIA